MKLAIKIGTRGSALALYQAEVVKARLVKDFPLVVVELVKIKTSGDMIRRSRAIPFQTKRIFTREIEEALLRGEIDLAVHSAKDLSVVMPEGLKIGAVLEREDPRDCLLTKDKRNLSQLPLGARVGTTSLRRKRQLLRWNPELCVEEIHGNIDTRIKKLEAGDFDAVVLALAGVKRLGLTHYVAEIFPEDKFYPAPGQGVIAIQSRVQDSELEEILETIHHRPTGERLDCERAFLARLEGGCQLPCGISTSVANGRLKGRAALFAIDSHERVEVSHEGPADDPTEVGDQLAKIILENGGEAILERLKQMGRMKKKK